MRLVLNTSNDGAPVPSDPRSVRSTTLPGAARVSILSMCLVGFFLLLQLLMGAGCSRQVRVDKALVQAQELVAEGRYPEAEIEYLKVLQAEPKHAKAVVGLAELYTRQGRWSLAVPLLMEAIALAPQEVSVRLSLCDFYLRAGRMEDVRREADLVLRQDEHHAAALLLLALGSVSDAEREDCRQRVSVLSGSSKDAAVVHLTEAMMLLREGDAAKAEAEAMRGIEINPELEAGHLILGDILLVQGREQEAMDSIERGYQCADVRSPGKFRWIDELLRRGKVEQAATLLLALDAEVPGYYPVLIRLARIELEREDLGEADRWLGRALALDPRSVEAISLDAQLRLAEGKVGESIAILERLVQLAPQSAWVYFEMAKAHLKAGEYSAALTDLNRSIELDKGPIEPRLVRIELTLSLGDVPSALAWLDELLQAVPEHRGALLLLAEARRLSGQWDQAAAVYREMLARNPVDPEAMFRLGQLRIVQNRPDEARALFESVLEIVPSHLPSLSALADMDLREDNVKASLERIQERLREDPEAIGPRFLLAQIHLAAGEQAEAEEQLNGIIELAPTWRPPYLILARLYVDSDQVAEARTRLNELLSRRPEDERATIMLALLDEMEFSYEAAAARYERHIQVHPDSILAINNLAYLYSTHLDQLDRAFELASEARKRSRSDASIADTFGWVLLQRGEHRRALGILQTAEQQVSMTPDGRYHLGLAYYHAGMVFPASNALASAVSSGQDFFGREDALTRLAVLRVDPSNPGAEDVRILNQVLEENSADAVALPLLARIHQLAGREEEAERLFEKALGEEANCVTALVGLARMYAERPGGHDRAMKLAETARVVAPNDPVVARLLGHLAFRAGDYPRAVGLLQESLLQIRDDADLRRELASAYYNVGRLREAQALLRELAGRESEFRDDWMQIHDLMGRHDVLGDPAEARQQAESCLGRSPDRAEALVVLGLVSEAEGDFAAAMEDYQRALTAVPWCAPVLRRMGLLAGGALSDDDAAFEYGSRAREYYPDDPELARVLGEVVYRRGDYDAARRLLQAAAAESEDAAFWYYLGLAQVKSNEAVAGRDSLRRAVELDPAHALADEARKVLRSL